jgi:uncharacterized SAM-binding protein YcdF (DUF218 family)
VTATRQGTHSKSGGSTNGALPFLLRWLGPAVLLSAAAFVIGFALFSERVSRMGQPTEIQPADAIVVLTGGQSRIEAALGLLQQNKGERLLISGVNADTTIVALRNVFDDGNKLFDCCIDVGYQARNTVGNAIEAITWLRSHDYRTVILVTNNYHMARSLLELQRLDPRLTIAPYPVVNSDLSNGKWMLQPDVVRVLLAEYMKYLGAVSRSVLPVPTSLALKV